MLVYRANCYWTGTEWALRTGATDLNGKSGRQPAQSGEWMRFRSIVINALNVSLRYRWWIRNQPLRCVFFELFQVFSLLWKNIHRTQCTPTWKWTERTLPECIILSISLPWVRIPVLTVYIDICPIPPLWISHLHSIRCDNNKIETQSQTLIQLCGNSSFLTNFSIVSSFIWNKLRTTRRDSLFGKLNTKCVYTVGSGFALTKNNPGLSSNSPAGSPYRYYFAIRIFLKGLVLLLLSAFFLQ